MDDFDKIIGYEQIKNELRRICDILTNPSKYEKFGVRVSQGLLLYGRPGVGKTLMAQCLINATGRQCYLCRKNSTNGNFVKQITQVFKDAQMHQPSIVFLDDMDKFSNEDVFHSDTDEFVTIQSCIDELKGQDVFVIATANDIRCLPRSLKRDGRFSNIIEVDSAQAEDSEKVVEYYLKQKKNLGDINVKEFAQIMENLTCAEIENIINEAGVYAAYGGKDKIGRDELLQACLRKMFEAPGEDEAMFDGPDEKRYVSYHEAGHAVISEVLWDKSIVLVSVAKHKGDIGGLTICKKYKPGERMTEQRKIEHIYRKLGGMAAIELVYGEIDTGANDDLHGAFTRVTELMDDFCGYGFDKFLDGHDNDSNEKKDRLNIAVATELQRMYHETKKILVQNREFLDKLANALMDHTTLLMSDIQKIKADCKIVK